MMLHSAILGGILALLVGAATLADTPLRPVARESVTIPSLEAEHLRLAAFRVTARPDHMIEYAPQIAEVSAMQRPSARLAVLPATRWEHKEGSDLWTRAALRSVSAFGEGLDSLTPRDIDFWCPAYRDNEAAERRAFWVGMMSALAKHESTYNPNAVGGPDLWYGLLQIYPPTARAYGCRARSGEALKDPVDNLSCASRIMNVTVARDNAIAVYDGRWRGVAADWGPMSNRRKIPEMAAWTRVQSYCKLPLRPEARPGSEIYVVRPKARVIRYAMRPEARPLTATISTMDVTTLQGG